VSWKERRSLTAPASSHSRRRRSPRSADTARHKLEDEIACADVWQDSGYVFTTMDGSPLRPDWLTSRFDDLARDTGLPRIGFHGIRHSFATLALAANVHPKIVQEILGHANVEITLNLYSHVVPGMQAEATTRIAALVIDS
jgi:integrase